MATRKRPNSAAELEVLTRSRRRCAYCFGLEADLGEKAGQLAHVDRDSSNSVADNLAYLCLPHHDKYDTTPRQTKRYTPAELRDYRVRLYAHFDELDPSRLRQVAASEKPNAPGGELHIYVGGEIRMGEGAAISSDGSHGGVVKIVANKGVVMPGGRISADGKHAGGKVSVETPNGDVDLGEGGRVSADATGDGPHGT